MTDGQHSITIRHYKASKNVRVWLSWRKHHWLHSLPCYVRYSLIVHQDTVFRPSMWIFLLLRCNDERRKCIGGSLAYCVRVCTYHTYIHTYIIHTSYIHHTYIIHTYAKLTNTLCKKETSRRQITWR